MYSAVSRTLTRGLLCSIQTVETRTADPRDPEPSGLQLGPRAFSTKAEIFDFHDFVCELVDMGARLIGSLRR
jgi:hypothetical protein